MQNTSKITKEEMQRLVLAGHSKNEICHLLGVSFATVTRLLKRFEIVMRPAAAPIPNSIGSHPCKWHGCTNTTDLHFCSRSCKNKAAVSKRRVVLMEAAVEYKGGKCQSCGYRRWRGALHFHHIDPLTKSFAIRNSGNTFAWAKIRSELDKCVLLCANCHAEVHAGLHDINPILAASPNPEEGMLRIRNAGLQVTKPTKTRMRPHCMDCGAVVCHGSARCLTCENIARLGRESKIQWPADEILLQQIDDTSVLAVARTLGVSDNAIRKRLKRRGHLI